MATKDGEVRKKASCKKQKPNFKEKIGLKPQERRTFQTGVLSLTKFIEAGRLGNGKHGKSYFTLANDFNVREEQSWGQNIVWVIPDFLIFFIFFFNPDFQYINKVKKKKSLKIMGQRLDQVI